MAGSRPFLLLVDGKVINCVETARAMFPPEGDNGEQHAIEVHLTRQGVQVNIMDEHDGLVETVHVYRGDDTFYTGDELADAPETNEEALEDLHASLAACVEFGVPLSDLFTYMLSRAAEVGYASGISRQRFVQTCLEVYEQALLSTVTDKTFAGEA